jgi:hypothetical protein
MVGKAVTILNAVERWLVIGLFVACLALFWVADQQREKADQAVKNLAQLQAQVEAQNTQAEQTIKDLTDQRDVRQARLDAFAAEREAADAANEQEIARLAGELERRPVRVRIVAQPTACGAGGGSPASDTATSAGAGAGDAAPAYGLLPAANSARLAGLMVEIETLNAAYASCRASLMHPMH